MRIRIKRNAAFFIILTIVLFMFFGQGLLVQWKIVHAENNQRTIRFAGDYNHAPYEYIDNNGEFKGFNVDIIKAIAREMDLEIEIIPMEWNDVIVSLDNREIDGIIGISQNEERLEKYKFTTPTVINEQVLLTRKETVHINELSDLQRQRVAYQKNDFNEYIVLGIPNVISHPKIGQEEVIDSLLEGEVDAVMVNKLVGLYYLQKNKNTDLVKIVGEPILYTQYGPAVNNDNEELMKILQEGLDKIKGDKIYDKIYKKWFGEDISYFVMVFNAYRKSIIAAVLFLLMIFSSLYFYNKRLQKEVIKRTRELKLANEDLIKHQEEIYNLAYYDSVTSLPNRTYFIKELNCILENRDPDNCLAVLMLDLDRFKHINDTLGHNVGDNVLKLLGNRVERLIKDDDIIARAGGDEYYILIKNANCKDHIINFAKAVLDDFKKPFYIEDYELYLTTSIGISIYPDSGLDSQAMIKNADLALYKAKELGGDCYYVYGVEIQSTGLEKMMFLNQLRQALENKEFILHYQPQIDIVTGKIIGLEALVRWNHPEQGLLYPDKFISLAEETGLIIPMGELILRDAAIQCKKWVDSGYDMMISVNISAKQFQHREFIKEVVNIIKESGLDPKNLTLEITETIAISNIEYTLSVLEDLGDLGISVAIDDFGTGYSSLSYLNEMNVNELKIDRSFISDIEKNDKNKLISNTIIILGKQLGMKVTAEGVENREQLDILREMECDIAQGYHFSKPVSSEKIDEMIKEKSPA